MSRCIISIVFILAYTLSTFAQDIEALTKAKPFRLDGGFNASCAAYDANGIELRNDPFYWVVNANLNLTFWDVVSAPFSINFSPQGKGFSYPYNQAQPFNQFGISPHYKGLTVHAGYRSVNLSQFSLAGNNFMGGGIELKPTTSKWQFTGMYGRLAKAANNFDDGAMIGSYLYNRLGYGGKIKYGSMQNNVELLLFHAKDNVNSSKLYSLIDSIPPAENLIVGFNTKQTILKKLLFDCEYTLSAYNADIRSEEIDLHNQFAVYNNMGFLFTPRLSSRFNKALQTSISYQGNKQNIKLNYRYIDPAYTSLGIPFMMNDVEDITLNYARNMFKNKVSLTLTGGLQRNNLNNEKADATTRTIGAINTNYSINKNLNLSAGFSNYNTSTVMIRIKELDSINYYQITQTSNFGINYRIAKTKATHAFNLIGSYQYASDISKQQSKLYNTMFSYSYGLIPIDLTLTSAINYTINSYEGLNNAGIGPSLSILKQCIKRTLQLGCSISMLQYKNNAIVLNETTSARISCAYTIKKQHRLSLIASHISKSDRIRNISFSENRISIEYSFYFQHK